MFDLFQRYRACIKSVRVARYDHIGDNLFVEATAVLVDDSLLHIRQAVIGGKLMKYSYYWCDKSSSLIRRWDNRDHWPNVATRPHHCHVGGMLGAVEDSPEGGDLDRILARVSRAIRAQAGER